MIEWLSANWMTALSLGSVGGAVAAIFKFIPKILRRLALMVDCEADRIRWEESDKLRDHRDRLRDNEILLLRTSVENHQNYISQLFRQSGISGVGSETERGLVDGNTDPSKLKILNSKPFEK